MMGSTISAPYRGMLGIYNGESGMKVGWSSSIGGSMGTSLPFILLTRSHYLKFRSMAYLPLTSIFHPILSIPTTINRIFSPTLNFLNRYRDSFTDGSQTRALEKFREEVDKGGAVAVLGKVKGHWEKKVQRQKEQIEKQKELREMEAKAGAGFEGTPSGKNVSVGTPTLRERFEAKARDLERQREMERDRVKKVGKEVEGKGE